jgi:Mor family transcriptional regulator
MARKIILATCPHCNYSWIYKGLRTWLFCNNCKKGFTLKRENRIYLNDIFKFNKALDDKVDGKGFLVKDEILKKKIIYNIIKNSENGITIGEIAKQANCSYETAQNHAKWLTLNLGDIQKVYIKLPPNITIYYMNKPNKRWKTIIKNKIIKELLGESQEPKSL